MGVIDDGVCPRCGYGKVDKTSSFGVCYPCEEELGEEFLRDEYYKQNLENFKNCSITKEEYDNNMKEYEEEINERKSYDTDEVEKYKKEHDLYWDSEATQLMYNERHTK